MSRPYIQHHPDAVVRSYQSVMNDMVAKINRSTDEHLGSVIKHVTASSLPYRNDSAMDLVTAALALILSHAQPLIGAAVAHAMRFAAQVSRYNSQEFHRSIKRHYGVDLFKDEPWIHKEMEMFEHENLRLIKSIPQDHVDELQGKIVQVLRDNGTAEDLKKVIQDVAGITERRARLIAIDQIGKLNGQLTKSRQTGIGISSYVWRGRLDRKERRTHVRREGQTYTWEDGPPLGLNPGQEVHCRCWAMPNYPALKDVDATIIS